MKLTTASLLCIGAINGVHALPAITFFYTSNCSGTAVGCWDIGVGICCTGGTNDIFGSARAEVEDITLDTFSDKHCTGIRTRGTPVWQCASPGYAIGSGMAFTVDHDNDRRSKVVLDTPTPEASCRTADVVFFDDENGERVAAKIPAEQLEEVLTAARTNDIGKLQQLERISTA